MIIKDVKLKLVQIFAGAHLYLSALPFCPSKSVMAKHRLGVQIYRHCKGYCGTTGCQLVKE